MKKSFFKVFSIILSSLILNGCAVGIITAGAGSAAYVANQETELSDQAKDIHINANIEDKLLRYKISNLKNVEVKVIEGTVLILGFVNSQQDYQFVENTARSAEFVKQVYNRLEIRQSYPMMTYLNDSITANMIRSRMVFSSKTYLSKVSVEVFDGVVYLYGLVGDNIEKSTAEEIARTGKGVTRVISYLKVKHN